ncbi:GNAT family protein [soil metagenome]
MAMTDTDALNAAAAQGELWTLPFTIVPSASTMRAYIESALQGVAAGTTLAYVTCVRESGQVVGSTRFFDIDRVNRRLELGWTWIAEPWQKSFVNTEAKYLMLRFAFEQLRCLRVQLSTDETNLRSRAAIVRLGARQEGIIRKERVMPDGRQRNSVVFSILDEEWPAVKAGLERQLERS